MRIEETTQGYSIGCDIFFIIQCIQLYMYICLICLLFVFISKICLVVSDDVVYMLTYFPASLLRSSGAVLMLQLRWREK